MGCWIIPTDIMFTDLKEEVQKELLKKLGLKTIEEGNLDIAPIAVVHTLEDWEDEEDQNILYG